MIGAIARTLAYAKAPRTTFTVLHPKRAVKLRKLKWDFRHAYAPRVAAVGAAAVALPLGFALGRMGGGSDEA
jgi:hypothetical protein